MNLNNLISQMGSSSNPMAFLMSILNPNQKQQVNQFQNKNESDKAQAIADYCNKNGIDKAKLQEIVNMLQKK